MSAPLREVALRVGRISWLPRLLPLITNVDRSVQLATRGRFTIVGLAGLPGVLLTVPGRRTGIPRSIPLLCTPWRDGVLVAGSNFGDARPPVWVLNVRAAESITMTYRGRVRRGTATELYGAEREVAWAEMVRRWPNYEEYAARAGRPIPVFWLRPD